MQQAEEHLDVLTKTGLKTGVSKPRGDVHRDGDYHRAVHVWIFAESTRELLLQRRASCKDSWPDLWDISSAGHISAGDSSLTSARRELEEELGITLPKDAFELIFVFLQECVINDGKYINNEYNDVYLVTTLDPIPLEAFALQPKKRGRRKGSKNKDDPKLTQMLGDATFHYARGDYDQACYSAKAVLREVIRLAPNLHESYHTLGLVYTSLQDYKRAMALYLIAAHLDAKESSLWKTIFTWSIEQGYVDQAGYCLLKAIKADPKDVTLRFHLARLYAELGHYQKAAAWYSNPSLRDWLKEHADTSEFNKLKWSYYQINKSPWSSLDEDEAFLSTADSAIRLLSKATRIVKDWKGLEYRAAFPLLKPAGANFYPPDMDKMEFELWKDSLEKHEQKEATGFFSVIKRHSEFILDSHLSDNKTGSHDLYIVPYSEEYKSLLAKASDLLHKAGDISDSPGLKRLLHSKADAFLSNDYYDSDIAWMELDSKLDVTIGPYETYEDKLFGYKATFEAYIGIRDDEATAQLKLFGDNLLLLEQNLPMDSAYKSEDVNAAPIRVIQLLYNAGDVKGPQTLAFNLPNDERIVKDRGSSMVMLKNVSEAK
ncbi:Nudix hydrolase 3 [Glycine soja]|uniref:Nudix hydrolase 3 n=1 Tax=Glycine soja TaxID=3848 RepID=A0A0B2RBR5_GLYSO|nr:Nudix hydrolase 3 [Glycine soja]